MGACRPRPVDIAPTPTVAVGSGDDVIEWPRPGADEFILGQGVPARDVHEVEVTIAVGEVVWMLRLVGAAHNVKTMSFDAARHPAVSHHTVSVADLELPQMSTAILDIVRVANDPTVVPNQLAQAIMRDPSMTLRVLAAANSPIYGCPRRVESVSRAVMMLGTKQIQNIAAVLALTPTLVSPLAPRLWRHAVATALWSDRVAHHMGLSEQDSLFTAALLHDIGIVMLLHHDPEGEQACLAAAQAGRGPLDEIERQHFGIDHAELGAQACRMWHLPQRIGELIEVHEQMPVPDDVGRGILALSDVLARAGGTPEFPWMTECGSAPGAQDDALASCGLASDDADALLSMLPEVEGELVAFG